MASKRLDPNASLADYKEHVARKQPMGNTKPKEHLAQKRTKIDKAIANAQAFQKQRTALINMSTKEKAGMALEVGIVSLATGMGNSAIQSGVRSAANKFLPAKIGVHHSVTPTSGIPFSGKVQTSVANKGLTAMDQKPGYSYFWDTGKGKSGIAKAVNEADFQTKQIADKILLDKGQKAVGYVTKIPRGAARPDTNVPGTIARELKGTQKIVGTVKASGPDFLGMTSFSPKNLKDLSRAVQVAKQKEFVKSAAKIGSVASIIAAAKNK